MKVIAISESVKEHLVKDFKVEDKKIAVIHHGIDVTRYRLAGSEYQAKRKKELGLSTGPVIGIVARLSAVKGHTYLIEAMKAVLEKVPGAQLLMVGEGDEQENLVRLINRLKLERNIFLITSTMDTAEILSIMDIFVLPSLKEGLGLSLMEAMAAGLAVIGSDVGGIRNLIQDGSSGLLVRPQDSVGLAATILELLQNPGKVTALGRQAQISIQKNFSPDKMILDTERLYSGCLNAGY